MQHDTSPTPICDAMRAGGQWNKNWEPMAQLDADWTEKFMAMVSAPLNSGVIDPKTFEPIFRSYPVPKAVNPRFGLGAQANIRPTM
jgi:hypothetical protein